MRAQRISEAGVAIVETALVFSLFFLILFGIMEFGTLFYNRAVLINASREGARLGTLFDVDTTNGFQASPYSDSDISQRVLDYSRDHVISFASSSDPSISVTPSWTDRRLNGNGGPLRVRVTYDFNFLLLPKLATALSGSNRLVAETFMRME